MITYVDAMLTLYRKDGLPTRYVMGKVAEGTGLGYHVNVLRPGNDLYPSVTVYAIDVVALGCTIPIDCDTEADVKKAIELLAATGVDWSKGYRQLFRENEYRVNAILEKVKRDMKRVCA